MKKIIENKPRFWFLVSVFFVLAIMTTGVIYLAFWPKETSETDTPVEENQDIKVYTYTDDEIKEIVTKRTITGKVLNASTEKVTLTATGQNYSFNITEETVIEKGVSLLKADSKELTAGKTVSISYNADTNEAINIWFEE